MPRVVVVDQDRTILHSIRQALSKANLRINTARTVRRGLALCHQAMTDLVLVKAELARDGFWAALSEDGPKAKVPPVVAMVATGAAPLIIDAAKRGAVEVLAKPLDSRKVRDVVMQVLRGPVVDAGQPVGWSAGAPFVASGAAMHAVLRHVGLAASRDVAVLFRGEPGTGKTHLARIVQRHGSRAGAPFGVADFAGKPPERIERRANAAWAGWNVATMAPFCSTGSMRYPGEFKVVCFRSSKKEVCSGWAATPRSQSMCGYSPLLAKISRAWYRKAVFAPTCIIRCVSSRLYCRRCANASTTCRNWPTGF